MMLPSLSLRTLAALVASTVAVSLASASALILDNFTRVGPSESVVAPFTAPSTATTNAYSGYVEVVVSGTGYSLFNVLNDAFHGVVAGAPLDGQYYQMNIGWNGAPLFPFAGEPRNINNFIVFVEGVGPVAPAYTPAYAANHTYHFVVNTGLLAGSQLQFGVSDGNFGDNGGAYFVDVWQLRQGADQNVPESPAPYAVIGLGLVMFLAARRHLQPEPRLVRVRR